MGTRVSSLTSHQSPNYDLFKLVFIPLGRRTYRRRVASTRRQRNGIASRAWPSPRPGSRPRRRSPLTVKRPLSSPRLAASSRRPTTFSPHPRSRPRSTRTTSQGLTRRRPMSPLLSRRLCAWLTGSGVFAALRATRSSSVSNSAPEWVTQCRPRDGQLRPKARF